MRNLLVLLISISVFISCESHNSAKSYSSKEIKKQLVAEFGEYNEVVPPSDKKLYEAYDQTLGLWKVPYHQTYIETKLGKAHVIVCGDKNFKPLVLLHGMNASSTMWYPNIEVLSKNYRVYAIDLIIEPSKSILNQKVYSINKVLKWYNEIFDALDLKEFNLIGASEGGWLATKIALENRKRISKLILLSPLQTFIWIPQSSEMTFGVIKSLFPDRKKMRDVLESMSSNFDQIAKPFVEQFYIASEKAEFSIVKFNINPFYKKELKTLTMPVMVLIGDQDIINNEKCIKKAKSSLPNVQAKIVKDAGHFLSIDQAEKVNDLMIDFLDK